MRPSGSIKLKYFYRKYFFHLSEADDEESPSEVEIPEVGQITSRRRYGGELAHNWSDFFFMLDILSSNFSVADVLMFVSKIDDQLSGFITKYFDKVGMNFECGMEALV